MTMEGSEPTTPGHLQPRPVLAPLPNNRPSPTRAESSANVTPASASSSTNTYLMPVSPLKGRTAGGAAYRPKISRTSGQRPACLVNASVTYCGDNRIFAFGGFDQYTDEGAWPVFASNAAD